MEKKRRAERLIVSLRWLVIVLGLASAGDSLPLVRLAVLVGILVAYNAVMAFCVADSARFARSGRRLAFASRMLDTAAITCVIAMASPGASLAYLLYWFVLIGCGYVNADLRKLTIITAIVLGANVVSTFFSLRQAGQASGLLAAIGIRSIVIIFGFFVSAYIAKSRSQDELAAERGSYLHAILECGVRLTSMRSVHELAVYVLQSAATEAAAGGGELLLLNDETQDLECEAYYAASLHSQDANAPTEALLRSYANWVVNTGREFTVRTGTKTEDAGNYINRDDRPAIAVPLLWQSSASEQDSSVLGVLVIWGLPGEDFGADALDILRIFAAIAGAAIVNLRLYTNMQKSFLRTLQSLANGLEARDEYTRGHSERVMQVACMVAEELSVPTESVDSLRNAAQLHDIGKIGVPDAILSKAGKLTAEEWETMRRHPIVSEEICRPLGLAPEVLFLIKHHHERIDAKGYPAGLPPNEQPLLQRILVVADSFDAMRSCRPYRDKMPEEELLGELNRSAGRTMDPTVVEALKQLMDRGDFDDVYEEHDRMTEGSVRVMDTRRAA